MLSQARIWCFGSFEVEQESRRILTHMLEDYAGKRAEVAQGITQLSSAALGIEEMDFVGYFQ